MVYLRINENSAQAKAFLEYIKTISFVEVVTKEEIPNSKTLKAMAEAEKGKVTRVKNVDDLIKKLNSK